MTSHRAYSRVVAADIVNVGPTSVAAVPPLTEFQLFKVNPRTLMLLTPMGATVTVSPAV
jgi:hypothetical protein